MDRPLLHVRLARDSTVLGWRRVAKDGFALGGAQAAERPAAQRVGSGETLDMEFTPDCAGAMTLEFGSAPRFPFVFARLPVHVRDRPVARASDVPRDDRFGALAALTRARASIRGYPRSRPR